MFLSLCCFIDNTPQRPFRFEFLIWVLASWTIEFLKRLTSCISVCPSSFLSRSSYPYDVSFDNTPQRQFRFEFIIFGNISYDWLVTIPNYVLCDKLRISILLLMCRGHTMLIRNHCIFKEYKWRNREEKALSKLIIQITNFA